MDDCKGHKSSNLMDYDMNGFTKNVMAYIQGSFQNSLFLTMALTFAATVA